MVDVVLIRPPQVRRLDGLGARGPLRLEPLRLEGLCAAAATASAAG